MNPDKPRWIPNLSNPAGAPNETAETLQVEFWVTGGPSGGISFAIFFRSEERLHQMDSGEKLHGNGWMEEYNMLENARRGKCCPVSSSFRWKMGEILRFWWKLLMPPKHWGKVTPKNPDASWTWIWLSVMLVTCQATSNSQITNSGMKYRWIYFTQLE